MMENCAILDWENDSRETFQPNSKKSVQLAYPIHDTHTKQALPNNTAPSFIVLSPHIPDNYLILTIFGKNFIKTPSRRVLTRRTFTSALNSEHPRFLNFFLVSQVFVLFTCLLICIFLFCLFFWLLCGKCIL